MWNFVIFTLRLTLFGLAINEANQKEGQVRHTKKIKNIYEIVVRNRKWKKPLEIYTKFGG
jgi:hypothetical protein